MGGLKTLLIWDAASARDIPSICFRFLKALSGERGARKRDREISWPIFRAFALSTLGQIGECASGLFSSFSASCRVACLLSNSPRIHSIVLLSMQSDRESKQYSGVRPSGTKMGSELTIYDVHTWHERVARECGSFILDNITSISSG